MNTAVEMFDATPEPAPRAPANAPQLRTLLLTDLVDSMGLVERLGDGPASDLFRAHDRLVLQLQQQWRGRLIDRSDGLLLLFERPIDGLGFALDYVRGLTALGEERGLSLRARAGLHVGEVLTWRNSEEAVSIGAKPLEVEGLAKPMAARLMAMARPGQILLSAVAEPLAHRAARELGDRGQHLVWKAWGRWRFKGVPEPQHIFEVGEPGVAPLRMPPNTPKAWRDIPLWRRPAALAAEAALLAAGVLGAWFITRPEPAIAFNQRDWVVIGDLRNLTGQSALDDSLEQAFRISLDQSRYVNVLSDMKARDTLGRMRRAPDTVLDRAVASEVALRDGARAVILPTVAEVGGRVRVSAEVIDPHTQTTVYAESAEGTGVTSTLDSIDDVTAALRAKLGEAVKSIEKDSAPLPQVATKNLDALRAYALGQKAYAQGDQHGALQYYQRATQIDPEFALAWLGQMRAQFAVVNAPAAIPPLRQAQKLRDHLVLREALYMDAWASNFDAPEQTAAKWQELAQLYPDYWPAQGNAGLWLYQANRFKEALPFAIAGTSPRYELASVQEDTVGRLRLAMGDYRQATSSFQRALAHGYRSSLRRLALVDAAQRNFASAQRRLGQIPSDDRYAYIERTSVNLDRGDWKAGQASARAALDLAKGETGFDSRYLHLPVAVANWLAGDREAALQAARSAADSAVAALGRPFDPDAADDAELATAAALVALRMDDADVAARVLSVLAKKPSLRAVPSVASLVFAIEAEQFRRAGQPLKAIGLLKPTLTGSERYQVRAVLMRAYEDAGNVPAALEQARWLQAHRGQAYVELECGHCLQALNVVDSNLALRTQSRLLARAGEAEKAGAAQAEFERRWPARTLPEYLQR
ncbi:putative peptide modification system cyclase [Lysobacter terrae]